MVQAIPLPHGPNFMDLLSTTVPHILDNVFAHTDHRGYAHLATASRALRERMSRMILPQTSSMLANAALAAVFSDMRNVFLTGPAGVGKSYTINRIRNMAEALEWKVCVTSTTGMSAQALDDATTLHRWAGLGVNNTSLDTMKELHAQGKPCGGGRKCWRDTDLLVIDEVSMLGARMLDKLAWLAHISEPDRSPFRGQSHMMNDGRPSRMLVVCVGDFYQLRPVGDRYAFTADAWGALNLATTALTISVRQQHDPMYAQMLHRLRKGDATSRDMATLERRVMRAADGAPMLVLRPARRKRSADGQLIQTVEDTEDKIAAHVASVMRNAAKAAKICVKQGDEAVPQMVYPVHLLALHDHTSMVNSAFYAALPAPQHLVHNAQDAFYRRIRQPNGSTRVEILDAQDVAVLLRTPAIRDRLDRFGRVVPASLGFKDGCQYLVTRNVRWLDRQRGNMMSLFNGMRCVCINRRMMALVGTGAEAVWVDISDSLQEVDTLHYLGQDNLYVSRFQMPLRMGFAVTIHASQGMTLDAAYIDLASTFACGQGYVAMSRVRTIDGVNIVGLGEAPFRAANRVKAFYGDPYPEPVLKTRPKRKVNEKQ